MRSIMFTIFLQQILGNKLLLILWGSIDPIGTICIGKGWAYSPIPSPRIREYSRTTSKERDENYTLKRGKEYLYRI